MHWLGFHAHVPQSWDLTSTALLFEDKLLSLEIGPVWKQEFPPERKLLCSGSLVQLKDQEITAQQYKHSQRKNLASQEWKVNWPGYVTTFKKTQVNRSLLKPIYVSRRSLTLKKKCWIKTPALQIKWPLWTFPKVNSPEFHEDTMPREKEEGEKEASSSCSEESSFTVADQEQTNYTNNGHRHSGPLEKCCNPARARVER